jgi:2-polyprenyl-3-methyl-5-hydroxy-6-metoxy-1,4-benzoquinol methylase
MHTASDFDQFYAIPDPWHISRAGFRDRILRRIVSKHTPGKSVLELGCGEGHLTQAIFHDAKSVTGIDFSNVAIGRAKARRLPNANFEVADILNASFEGYDIITAIECLYYLTPAELTAFFNKASREHNGKLLIVSGTIIGQNEHRQYFTHDVFLKMFADHDMAVVGFHNLSVYWRPLSSRIIANLMKLPFAHLGIDWLPSGRIYQRCYIICDGTASS